MSEVQKPGIAEQFQYSTELVENVSEIPSSVDQTELNSRGLYVVQGLDKSLAEQLVKASTQPDVMHNCPNDASKRFSSVEAVETWLKKGRLALPLVKKNSDGAMELVGFGWMGPGETGDDEPTIPGAKITFAIRLYEGATKQHAANPYTKAILATHNALYGNEGVWLETWEDNVRAVETYENNGFKLKEKVEKPGQRTRLYMVLENSDTQLDQQGKARKLKAFNWFKKLALDTVDYLGEAGPDNHSHWS